MHKILKGNNLIFIGMPGSGKSTNGVVLAKALGCNFLDADILIQNEKGMRLDEILDAFGTDGFNKIEEEVLSGIELRDTVIATGGSAVYGEKAMEHLRNIGTVIYLEIAYDDLKKRLGDLKKRGVSIKEGQTLYDLYMERKPLYERYADVTVNVTNQSIRESIDKIKKELAKLYEL